MRAGNRETYAPALALFLLCCMTLGGVTELSFFPFHYLELQYNSVSIFLSMFSFQSLCVYEYILIDIVNY